MDEDNIAKEAGEQAAKSAEEEAYMDEAYAKREAKQAEQFRALSSFLRSIWAKADGDFIRERVSEMEAQVDNAGKRGGREPTSEQAPSTGQQTSSHPPAPKGKGWYCPECKKFVNVNAFVGQIGDFDSTETLEQIKAFVASEAPADFQVECVECDHSAEWMDGE